MIRKKILSLLIAVSMVVTMIPTLVVQIGAGEPGSCPNNCDAADCTGTCVPEFTVNLVARAMENENWANGHVFTGEGVKIQGNGTYTATVALPENTRTFFPSIVLRSPGVDYSEAGDIVTSGSTPVPAGYEEAQLTFTGITVAPAGTPAASLTGTLQEKLVFASDDADDPVIGFVNVSLWNAYYAGAQRITGGGTTPHAPETPDVGNFLVFAAAPTSITVTFTVSGIDLGGGDAPECNCGDDCPADCPCPTCPNRPAEITVIYDMQNDPALATWTGRSPHPTHGWLNAATASVVTIDATATPKTMTVSVRTGTSQGLRIDMSGFIASVVKANHTYTIEYAGTSTDRGRLRHNPSSTVLAESATAGEPFDLSWTATAEQITSLAGDNISFGNASGNVDITYTGIRILQECPPNCDHPDCIGLECSGDPETCPIPGCTQCAPRDPSEPIWFLDIEKCVAAGADGTAENIRALGSPTYRPGVRRQTSTDNSLVMINGGFNWTTTAGRDLNIETGLEVGGTNTSSARNAVDGFTPVVGNRYMVVFDASGVIDGEENALRVRGNNAHADAPWTTITELNALETVTVRHAWTQLAGVEGQRNDVVINGNAPRVSANIFNLRIYQVCTTGDCGECQECENPIVTVCDVCNEDPCVCPTGTPCAVCGNDPCTCPGNTCQCNCLPGQCVITPPECRTCTIHTGVCVNDCACPKGENLPVELMVRSGPPTGDWIIYRSPVLNINTNRQYTITTTMPIGIEYICLMAIRAEGSNENRPVGSVVEEWGEDSVPGTAVAAPAAFADAQVVLDSVKINGVPYNVAEMEFGLVPPDGPFAGYADGGIWNAWDGSSRRLPGAPEDNRNGERFLAPHTPATVVEVTFTVFGITGEGANAEICTAHGVEVCACPCHAGGAECQCNVLCIDGTPNHALGAWRTDIPASCTMEGRESAGCTRMGCTYEEFRAIPTLSPNGTHVWGAWTVVTPATATTEGSERRECTICDASQTRVIPAQECLCNQCDTCGGCYIDPLAIRLALGGVFNEGGEGWDTSIDSSYLVVTGNVTSHTFTLNVPEDNYYQFFYGLRLAQYGTTLDDRVKYGDPAPAAFRNAKVTVESVKINGVEIPTTDTEDLDLVSYVEATHCIYGTNPNPESVASGECKCGRQCDMLAGRTSVQLWNAWWGPNRRLAASSLQIYNHDTSGGVMFQHPDSTATDHAIRTIEVTISIINASCPDPSKTACTCERDLCADGHEYADGVLIQARDCLHPNTFEYTCVLCGDVKVETVGNAMGHDFSRTGTAATWVVTVEPGCGFNGTRLKQCARAGCEELDTANPQTVPALIPCGEADCPWCSGQLCLSCGQPAHEGPCGGSDPETCPNCGQPAHEGDCQTGSNCVFCGQPGCNGACIVPENCPKGASCGGNSLDCTGDCNLLGDVDDQEGVQINDALQVLLAAIGAPSTVDGNPAALRASLITPESRIAGKPGIADALHVLLRAIGAPGMIPL